MCLPKKKNKLARKKLRFEKKKKKKMPQIFRSRHTNMTDYCLTN